MKATPEQMHAALTHCVDFARTMLESAGEFYPFGASIDLKGQVRAAAGWTGEERPHSEDVYALLVEGMRNALKEGHALAIAVAADVNIPAKYAPVYADGLRITWESEGHSRFIYVPYRLSRRGLFRRKRTARFADPFSVELDPVV